MEVKICCELNLFHDVLTMQIDIKYFVVSTGIRKLILGFLAGGAKKWAI